MNKVPESFCFWLLVDVDKVSDLEFCNWKYEASNCFNPFQLLDIYSVTMIQPLNTVTDVLLWLHMQSMFKKPSLVQLPQLSLHTLYIHIFMVQ